MTIPGELYILAIIVSVLLSLVGSGNVFHKDNRYMGIICLFFAVMSWQIVIQLSYSTIIFNENQYNISLLFPELREIAKTYLFGGIVAGLVLIGLNNKDLLEKLQSKIPKRKNKEVVEENPFEFKPMEEVKPKRIIKKKIVKKPIKKE